MGSVRVLSRKLLVAALIACPCAEAATVRVKTLPDGCLLRWQSTGWMLQRLGRLRAFGLADDWLLRTLETYRASREAVMDRIPMILRMDDLAEQEAKMNLRRILAISDLREREAHKATIVAEYNDTLRRNLLAIGLIIHARKSAHQDLALLLSRHSAQLPNGALRDAVVAEARYQNLAAKNLGPLEQESRERERLWINRPAPILTPEDHSLNRSSRLPRPGEPLPVDPDPRPDMPQVGNADSGEDWEDSGILARLIGRLLPWRKAAN